MIVPVYPGRVVLRILSTDNQTCFVVVLIIFNDGVTLHCICFRKPVIQYIVRKVSRVYFTRRQFIQLISHPSCLSPGFILTGIPFFCSEFLISFACDLWVNPFWKCFRLENSAWDFFGGGGLIFGPGIFWVPYRP